MIREQFADLAAVVAGVNEVREVSDLGPLTTESMACVAFYGVLLSDRRLAISLDGTPEDGLTVDEAMDANGEWLAIFRSSDDPTQLLVLTDAFGFQSLFHSLVDGEIPQLVLGTSARAVAFRRNSAGQGFSPDWPQILGNLATTDPWASTISSDRTSDVSTRVMKPFQMLIIRDGVATIGPRTDFVRDPEADYSTLISRGIANAVGQLRTLAKSPFASRRINLSGGKDSRLMFALLHAAESTADFDVRTLDPAAWSAPAARDGLTQDLLIADALRRRYGMSWWQDQGFRTETVDPLEPLESWQRFNSSLNYRYRLIRSWTARDGMVAELRGASGETYREYWSYYWKRHSRFAEVSGTPDTFAEDARVLFEEIYSLDLIPDDLVEQTFEHFLDSLRGTGKSDILDAGDRHFSLYRNRAHFGTTFQFALDGTLPIFPLNQVAFVRAGDLLAPQTRRDGAVFFDVIEAIAPELNDLPFDSKQWNERIRARRDPSAQHVEGSTWTVPESTDSLIEFAENEALSRDARATARERQDHHHTYTDAKPFALSQTREILDEILTIDDAAHALNPQLRSRLMSLPEENIGLAQTQLGKLASIRDLVIGEVPGRTMFFGPDPDVHALKLAQLGRATIPAPPSFRRDLSTLLFRVSVARDDDELTAEILVDHSEGHDLEYAFYLRSGSQTISRREYGPDRHAAFRQPADGRTYSIQAFARYSRQPDQVFILRSREIL